MKTTYSKFPAENKIIVTREFAASPESTWQAWTDEKLLVRWWAPKPWKAETAKMEFREGGFWLYCMVGPDGSRHWARMDFKKIDSLKYFTAKDSFCDENGTVITDPPGMDWKVEFTKTDTGTKVQVELLFDSEKNLNTILEMGFEEGFSSAHNNLDELLSK